MPVTENSKINSGDFNNIRNIIDAVMGVGNQDPTAAYAANPTFGYGQTLKSSAKSINELIDQTDWDNLRYDIVNARIHQTGAAFTANTNASNSADRTKLRFTSASTAFLIVGMAVFGISPHPITAIKFITEITVAGSDRIITLSAATESTVNSGTTIYFGPGSVSDFQEGTQVSASAINLYETLSTTAASSDRLLVAAGQFSTTAATSVNRTWSGATSPTFWKDEISTVVTVTFSDSNRARWFFNSGGEVRIQSQRTGGRSDSQNNAWSSLLSTAGQRSFGAQTPSSGFSPMNGQNFYRLTNSYQTFYSISSSAPYAANVYQLEAKCNVADNSTGTASVIDIRVRFIGGYVDPGSNPFDSPQTNDEIDGTFTVTATQKYADATVLPSGNFSVTLPSYSATALAGS